MTGSGTGQATSARVRVAASAASVNHRFLDIQLRLPEAFALLEPSLRDYVATRLTRGRVEVQLRLEAGGETTQRLSVDRQAVRALREQFVDLAAEGLVDDLSLGAADLLRIPQLVRFAAEASAFEAEDEQALFTALDQAVDELLQSRAAEGGRIGEAMGERLTSFRTLVARVSARREELRGDLLANLRRRLTVLLEGREVPEDRLAQEVAILADRADVGEELDRLVSHLDHFAELMAAEGAVGKRLDFLCQELLREVNTLGSKCRDAATTREVLEAKHLCEQIREQVQNVE